MAPLSVGGGSEPQPRWGIPRRVFATHVVRSHHLEHGCFQPADRGPYRTGRHRPHLDIVTRTPPCPIRDTDSRCLRPTGEVGIRRIGHTGEHMRSHARRLDPRARGFLIRPESNFLLRQWCAHVRPTHIATTTQPLTAPVVRQPERHVRRTIVTTDIAQRLDRYAGP